jgi:hypothetical protein
MSMACEKGWGGYLLRWQAVDSDWSVRSPPTQLEWHSGVLSCGLSIGKLVGELNCLLLGEGKAFIKLFLEIFYGKKKNGFTWERNV